MLTRKAYAGVAGKANIVTAGKLQFTNFEPLTNGTIIDANPDFYDRAHPSKIDRRIRAHLDSFIIPLTHGHARVLPKFFNKAKDSCGSPAVSQRQACSDSATSARGIHKRRSFATDGTELYDNNAYIITSTYQDAYLKMFTIHITEPTNPENPPRVRHDSMRRLAFDRLQ